MAKKKVAKKKAPAKKKVAKKKVAVKRKAAKKPIKRKAVKKVAKKKVAKKKVAAKKKVSTKKKDEKEKVIVKKNVARIIKKKRSAIEKPEFKPYQRKHSEAYMSKKQIAHFRQILSTWRTQLQEEVERTISHMQEDASNFPDPADRATQEEEFGLELRTRDRERKLLRKINEAIQRIDDGTFGYCEETGDEIGIKRLEARPVATLCLEAQERHELKEKQFRDTIHSDR